MPVPFVTLLVLALLSNGQATAKVQIDETWTRRVPPTRIIDNVYYVGSADLASYLITTPDGHILIDTGVTQNADAVLASIEALGFNPDDVRYLLTTQAHFDHVGAHAAVQKATGAQIVAAEGDASLIEGGGKGDYHFGPDYYFPAAKVARVIHDGDTVRLGGLALRAHLTPGHTKGCTTWTTTVRDAAGDERHVLFAGSTSVNPGVKLVDNAEYPGIAADYERSFAVLTSLPCDLCLTAHLSAMDGLAKLARLRQSPAINPFLNGAEFKSSVKASERRFRAELAKQRNTR